MPYLAVDKDGTEKIFEQKPYRNTHFDMWLRESMTENERVQLPRGSINKLIGTELTWDDEPFEI